MTVLPGAASASGGHLRSLRPSHRTGNGHVGYHGLTIAGPGGTLGAYRGAVAPRGDGPRVVRADPTRSVERYLLGTSKLHVTDEVYAEAQGPIAAP